MGKTLTKKINSKYYPAFLFVAILAVWEMLSRLGVFPPFILPPPSSIVISLFTDFKSMQLDILVTLYEAFAGFIIAIVLSFLIAVLMDALRAFKKTIYPLLIISQTIPIIIIAPLFIIWFGYGYTPKLIIVILICFFPITISLMQSLSGVDNELIDLLRSMGSGRLQIYRYVKLPASMPGFFSGLKIAATYSIMGATIGEWVGGKDGLGVYMIRAKQSFATDRVFAAILVITILSILLLKFIELIERRTMPWKIKAGEPYID
ncbi:MAG: ABC transporter permease [Actinomycetia bacterium]|nr:ABC transporter permease [Actinomycetes bacterium]